MTTPVRLQLSRRVGFRLQEHSLATNGLPAVVVARPTRWGNPVDRKSYDDVAAMLGPDRLPTDWRAWVVKSFDAWLGGEIPELGTPPTTAAIAAELRGKNLACWCPTGACCHADVLLVLANE